MCSMASHKGWDSWPPDNPRIFANIHYKYTIHIPPGFCCFHWSCARLGCVQGLLDHGGLSHPCPYSPPTPTPSLPPQSSTLGLCLLSIQVDAFRYSHLPVREIELNTFMMDNINFAKPLMWGQYKHALETTSYIPVVQFSVSTVFILLFNRKANSMFEYPSFQMSKLYKCNFTLLSFTSISFLLTKVSDFL